MAKNIQLLIIDPQWDFCDPTGALYVTGAEKDMSRLAALITRNLDRIDDIRVTLDSHHLVHIAQPIMWVDKNGNHPNPFTIINEADVVGRDAQWRAYNPGYQQKQVEYVKLLAAANRYPLCIWPPHCLIGTDGHRVHPVLQPALRAWEDQFAIIDYVTKGSSTFREHYSVVKAEIEDPDDAVSTGLNTKFIERLQAADEIWVAGEALSHCVANSVRDIATEFGDEHVKKFVLIEDASSPVGDLPGSTMFRDMADAFVKELVGKGMRIAKTSDF